MAQRRGTLRGKLFLIIAVVYLAAFFLEMVLYLQWYRMRQDVELEANLDSAHDMALSVESFIDSLADQQVALGNAIASIAPGNEQKVQAYLNEAVNLYPVVEDISWLSPQGKVLASTDEGLIGVDYSGRAIIRGLQEGRNWSVSNLLRDTAVSKPYFYLISALRDPSHNITGMVAMRIVAQMLQGAVWETEQEENMQLFIYDQTGALVWIQPPNVPIGTPMAPTDESLRQALEGKQVSHVDKVHFSARVPIKGLGWVSGVDRHIVDVMAPIRRNVAWNGVFMLFIAALSLLVVRRISQQIIHGVQRLQDHAQALQRGELAYRSAPLALAELNELATGFNEATSALDENVKHQGEILSQLQERESELSTLNTSLQQDIEYRNRMVSALREAERRAFRRTQELEAVLNTVPAAVFIAQDPKCELVTGNVAAYKMFDVPEGTNLSKTPSDRADRLPLKFYRNGQELPAEELFLQRALATGGEVRNDETQITYENGDTKTVYGHAAPYKDDQGHIIGAVAALVDITERKKAEDELRRFTEELERSNQELERFAYVASHDLQEPLRMIVSYLSLLARRYSGKFDTQADEFIRFAIDGGNRMQDMISDLLQYSRVQREPLSLRPVDTMHVLHVALKNLKVLIEETGALIEAAPLPMVRGNPMQISLVFQNLIVNALKFHAPDRPPHIKIRAAAAEYSRLGNVLKWQFDVEDNGIGIPQESLEAVFTIFNRLGPRSKYPGSGMGLAICRKIVEKHGGIIWIDSVLEESTIVHFTLPALDEGLADE